MLDSISPRRALATAAVVVGALLATAAPASAAQLSGGSTSLNFDSATLKALAKAGYDIRVLRPGTVPKKGRAVFPIRGGKADPATLAGSIDHAGGVAFIKGKTTVRLTGFRVTVGRRSSLSAVVGGSRVKILSLSTTKAKVKRRGFATTVSGVRGSLTTAASKALDKAFKTKLFTPGLKLGTATVAAKFAEADLAKKGATTLTLDPGTAAALTSLGVTASPIAPARAAGGGLAFPIAGGTSVNLVSLEGTIAHRGGIAFTKGATRVTLTDFLIRIDDKADLSAKIAGASKATEIANVDFAAAKRSVKGRTITLTGVQVTLNAASAAALNQAFGTTALKAGTPLGTATVVATGK